MLPSSVQSSAWKLVPMASLPKLPTICPLTKIRQAVKVPVLANITEFGKTPLFSVDDLRPTGVGMVLYPLSAFRAMNKAAEVVYTAIRRDGHQTQCG